MVTRTNFPPLALVVAALAAGLAACAEKSDFPANRTELRETFEKVVEAWDQRGEPQKFGCGGAETPCLEMFKVEVASGGLGLAWHVRLPKDAGQVFIPSLENLAGGWWAEMEGACRFPFVAIMRKHHAFFEYRYYDAAGNPLFQHKIGSADCDRYFEAQDRLVELLSSPEELSVEEIAYKAGPAVVQLSVWSAAGAHLGTGSGFFIEPGVLLTNAHVVERAYSAEVRSARDLYEHVTIGKLDRQSDLALLRVKAQRERLLRIAHPSDPAPGQRVVAVGSPLGLEGTVTDGLVSAIRQEANGVQIIQTSAPLSPGSSGGPLLNLRGEVIGVNSSGMQEGENLNFAVAAETVHRFLRAPDAPDQLHPARERVLWRAILKWVGVSLAAIVALLFSERGWWLITILVFAVWIVAAALRGVWTLMRRIFQR